MINMNDLIQQYALRSSILNAQGEFTPPQQNTQPQGLLNSPAFGQALMRAAAGIAAAEQGGYGLGGALAIGANAFGDTIAAEKDRREKAQKEATQDQLAALKDIISLKTQQEELALRMQAASVARRAQQDALDERARERQAEEARRQAIYGSGDERLIKAYEMFGDGAAQDIFLTAQKPQERKTITVDGIPYYEDTKEPVIPFNGGVPPVKPDALVPGLNVADNARPTPDDAKAIKTVKQAYTQLQTLLPEYRGLVEKYGSEIEGSGKAKMIEQKKAQIALQVKNLEELGALQEADRQIIDDMMVSPVRKNTVPLLGRINPTRVFDKGRAVRGADDFKDYLDVRYDTALETRGYVDPARAKKPDAVGQFVTKSGISYEVVE